ncbi:uncharacterized protein LDX57_001980 [Aspergillus melleus]|uniref:uncharacterized protein n=1 Tax=Aspergillus melleus TaxID=138277 RepID=UPI001E8DF57C|nr:uncharacterized protein LDX57_001980 [Aspergillus melleus]KAH8424222.1 hypothetical protein LDX57_001980 [Aspergillus melleus]
MKFSGAMNIAALAALSFSPVALAALDFSSVAVALLNPSCRDAVDSISRMSSHIIQNMQKYACAAGCEPVISQWDSEVKNDIVDALIEDGVRYTGIHDPVAQKKFAAGINEVFVTVTTKCQDKFEDKHLCHDPDSLNPFVQCIDDNSRAAVVKSLRGLLPYMSEQRCRKVADYFNSDQLWKEDFPEHFKEYVDQCHDL